MIQIIAKILITIFLLYGVFFVWTSTINFKEIIQSPFKKLFHLNSPVEVPKIQAGLMNLQMRYKEGLNVEGIPWKSDFQEYNLIIDNLTQSTEMTDFKVDLQVPGGIVKYEIMQSYGFDDIDFFSKTEQMKIGNKDQINEIVKTYSNHFHIKASKVFPKSHLTVKLIIKLTCDHNNGFIKYNYNYINENGNRVLNDMVYLMPFTEKSGFVFFKIDKENLVGKYDYNIETIPDRPLIFKADGSVE
ncbi:MAG TPA: hypothetical protein PLM70_08455 [Bacteroidales bacterium]|nr:hypothetical protein [Bacteroidales bacterium]